ncbi:MAG: uracil-DNA glycosylase [Bacteroidetes bacterium]|nr:MAG: uracil-DNA glycosylase [Bacteroidota bacterium]
MYPLLEELRSALTYEIALAGALAPLDEGTSSGKVAPAEALHEAGGEHSPAVERVEAAPCTGEGATAPPPAVVKESSPPPASMPATDLFGNPVDPTRDPSRSPYERIEALIPADSPLHRMHTLDEVARYVAETVLIPLDAQRLNPVFGTGNPEADLMVIGEAPGADEDRQGEPFVGRAGQLLNKILAAIGFDRDDVYIANILKSRPPNNRDPLPEEVAAHIPILYKQIALVRPKLILAVGKTAGNSLLGRSSSLKDLRGKFHDFHGLPVLVTYHPAALLRNPQWKRPTWEDVKLLRARYDQLTGRA